MKRIGMGAGVLSYFVATSLVAGVNSWTSQVTGAWENLSWSLGVRPDISQSGIMITNYGQKAVIIGANTVNNFPSTLTISNLLLAGTPLSTNTLLLNYTGTVRGLQVFGGLNVEQNGALLNDYGLLRVDGGETYVFGSMDQLGGSNIFSQGLSVYGWYNVTNGAVSCAGGRLEGHFYQVGGNASLGGFSLGSYSTSEGDYHVSDGTTSFYALGVGDSGFGSFEQSNSDVRVTTTISIGNPEYPDQSDGGYAVDGGSLTVSNVDIGPGFFGVSSGIVRAHQITVVADAYDPYTVFYGTVAISGGTVMVDSLRRGNSATMTVSGGVVTVSSNMEYGLNLTGGSLYCSNIWFSEYVTPPYGAASFWMSNATLVVTNTLSTYSQTSFRVLGGLLDCSNIFVGGPMSLAGGTVVNRGLLEIGGGQFGCAVTNVQLGKLKLTSSGHFAIATNPCVVRFQDSSDQAWSNVETLWIDGWQGATNGGGASRVYVGNSGHGLTTAQLSRIIFNGNSYARQLSTGEIVPTNQPTMAIQPASTNIVVMWPTAISNSFHLQAATNVTGPYADVTNATSPFTISVDSGRKFFRLH